ncbi:MAG: histidine--tRNA ligase [Candidatus Odinarchaeia archaeon]
MNNTLQPVKGMKDYLPEEKKCLNYITSVVRSLFVRYGYLEVSTPVLEYFNLLAKKAGEEIREKMYVFEDKAGRVVALRPEMTAPITRVYIDSFMKGAPKPVRLGYIGTCYRYDNPQMGRWREFWQAGFELFGSPYPEADFEILEIAWRLMRKLGFKSFKLKLGHVGIIRNVLNAENVKEEHQDKTLSLIDMAKEEELLQFLDQISLPQSAVGKILEILRISEIPPKKAFEKARDLLAEYPEALRSLDNLEEIYNLSEYCALSENIAIDLSLARGLEYYTGMIFEIFVDSLPIAVGGGGRYDRLVETFGGTSTPAVGFSPGLDRLMLAMEKENIKPDIEEVKKILVTYTSEKVLSAAAKIAGILRDSAFTVELDVMRRKLKKSLSYAASNNFTYVVIVGEQELKRDSVCVRNMEKNIQEEIKIVDLPTFLRGRNE